MRYRISLPHAASCEVLVQAGKCWAVFEYADAATDRFEPKAGVGWTALPGPSRHVAREAVLNAMLATAIDGFTRTVEIPS